MFLEFYGFSEQPFGVTPDPHFLYMGPAYQEAFASLIYGIETGRGFMALIAAPGLGKTTLILKLMETLRNSAQTAFLFQTHNDSREFMKNLLMDLHVEPTGKDMSDLQAQLQEVLARGMNSGKRLVLVIDEAQNLDDSVLEMVRMLSNFETPQEKLLQIILVGQPALADKLTRPNMTQLRQRISIITYFSPLSSREIGKYIQSRIRKAGYHGRSLFTSRAVALIATYSRGVPRNVNNLCFNALSLGYAKGQRKVDESIIREVLADLKLESLGERAGDARIAAMPTRPQSVAQGGTPAGSPSLLNWGGILDQVDISDDAVSRARNRGNSRQSSHGWALVFLAVAAILAFVWRASWLKPASGIVVQAMSRMEGISGTKQNVVTNDPTPAAEPAKNMTAPGQAPNVTTDNKPGSIQDDSNAERKDITETSSVSPADDRAAQLPGVTDQVAETSAAAAKADPTSMRSPGPEVPAFGAPSRSDADDESSPETLRGKLILQSSVSGARIAVNGHVDPKWVTPHLFRLAPGTYDISVSKGGYLTWSRQLRVSEGGEQWVMADLRAEEANGIFVVETDPAGMAVFIDGKSYGYSRVETVLNAGWHVCEVFPGKGIQPVVGRFHLNAGGELTKRIKVTRVPATGSRAPAIPTSDGSTRLFTNQEGGM